MTKFMAVDYGLERTGTAFSDPEEKMAFPLATLRLADFGSRKALLDGLASLAVKNGVQAVVMGLPLHIDGSESMMARQVRNITKRIMYRLRLPFYWMPEILSSSEAEMYLRAAGIRAEKLKKALDQQAACRILDSFLSQPAHLRMQICFNPQSPPSAD